MSDRRKIGDGGTLNARVGPLDHTGLELAIDDDPATLAAIREDAAATTLPADLRAAVRTYESEIGERGEFLWRWLYQVAELVTLPCVPAEHVRTVSEIKTLLAMYNVLLDDLAEKHDDSETFWELAAVAIPGSRPDWDRPDVDARYAEVAREVWSLVEAKLVGAPRHDEFRDVFTFDLRQAIDAMDHSRLQGRQPELATLIETWEYDSHNVMFYAAVDVDLMYSPAFDSSDLGALREIVHDCQRMWRIGNWVVTWERELAERDFSAGPIVAAVQEGILTRELLAELEAGAVDPDAVADRIRGSNVEAAFLADWQRRHDELRDRTVSVGSVDVDALIGAMETLLQYHLASRGFR